MNHNLTNLLLALATNELLHNVFEVKNMREKLKRLTAYMNKKAYKELPLNINTRAKSYAVSLVAFIAFVGPLWLVFSWLDPTPELAIKLAIGLLTATFIATAITVDKWHVDVEKITRPFMHKR